ncbi:MAG: histidine phosphatase family protein, partial [Wenzhouxiangella sp.]|nr:histidine phosphatase family protein [Wenzhouxiangella sp.]
MLTRLSRFALIAWLLLPLAGLAQQCDDAAGLTVYLVRHAERAEDGSDDPPLSPEGQARAQALRAVLDDVELAAIHTTQL